MILNLKNLAIWLAERIFVYNLRKRFFQNMQFLQNHKGNYGASCKPKNSTSMEQFFLPNPKSLLLKIFLVFLPKIISFLDCLILRNQTFIWNFIKTLSAVFEKKWYWLPDWLTDWKSCLHKTPLCLKTRVQQYQ